MAVERNFTPRIVMIWGLAALAALWLLMTALGGVFANQSPGLAVNLYPASGFAYESLARARVYGTAKNLGAVQVSAADAELARDALRREPLATSALAILGIAKAGSGDGAGGEKLVALSNRLSKRDLAANGWLINRFGNAGRTADVLRLLDEALKVNPDLAMQYMPAMAEALTHDETLGTFETLLKRSPEWSDQFWPAVASNPAALSNAERLRSRLVGRAHEVDDVDRMLLAAFITAKRFDLAIAYERLLPDRDAQAGLVRDPSFSTMPQLPPLEWDLQVDGRISAAISQSNNSLEMNALQGSGGTVARQLVDLPAGAYQLRAKLGSAAPPAGSDIIIRLSCASQPGSPATVVKRLDGDIDAHFTVPEGGCRYQWLEVEFSAEDAGGPVTASLAEVRIDPARAVESDAVKAPGSVPEPVATPAP